MGIGTRWPRILVSSILISGSVMSWFMTWPTWG